MPVHVHIHTGRHEIRDDEKRTYQVRFRYPGVAGRQKVIEVEASSTEEAHRLARKKIQESGGGWLLMPNETRDMRMTDPPESEAQRRFMRWAAENPGKSGVPAKVSSEYNEADPGGKLPERISDFSRRLDRLHDRMTGTRDEWSEAAREAALAARRAKAEGSPAAHSAAAASHTKAAAAHETEARARGEWGKPSRTGSHGYSHSMHGSAAFYHNKAAETHGTPEYERNAKEAHRNSGFANSSSAKVQKAGSEYTAPAVQHKEPEPLTAQQHSARRIERYLRENRIRMR